MSNSPIMHRGMAPPHGFALSILRSNSTVSTFFSFAKISAAHAPDGPPPTTATLYFMSREVEDDDDALWDTPPPLMNDDGAKDATDPTRMEETTSFMVTMCIGCRFGG